MINWLERSFRRDSMLLVWGACFILLLAAVVHVLEPRKIVKWDDVPAKSAAP